MMQGIEIQLSREHVATCDVVSNNMCDQQRERFTNGPTPQASGRERTQAV